MNAAVHSNEVGMALSFTTCVQQARLSLGSVAPPVFGSVAPLLLMMFVAFRNLTKRKNKKRNRTNLVELTETHIVGGWTRKPACRPVIVSHKTLNKGNIQKNATNETCMDKPTGLLSCGARLLEKTVNSC